MGGFCPDDWHGTTETDLQQMAMGEDYWMFGGDTLSQPFRSPRNRPLSEERRREYAIHDDAIAQAKAEGLTFHHLPVAEQVQRLDAAEAALSTKKGAE
jgi:hypothetical protein